MKAGEVVAGKYRLDARLGLGGMGEVWRASHATTGREFALKFMHAQYASSATSRQRFTREARVSAKINHPNVIDIFDVGEHEDGSLYLAMELLEGVSLADAFHAQQPLNVQEFLTVMLDTTRALVAAHAVGVIHRDIKPGNIFLHKDRGTGFASAKILDFGISKLGGPDEGNHTKTGAVLGSPRYMSPEQTRSAADVDHRTDLWAMGVILFEGLTGTWPHQGDSFSSLVVSICTQPPASIDLMVPELPEPLRSIVRDLLKPIDQRMQTAVELEARLVTIIADPFFSYLPLPRPLHSPGESAKSVSGLRIRPALLTTTADRLAAAAGGAVESRRMSQPRPEELANLRASSAGIESRRMSQPPVQPVTPAELFIEEDGPTQVRPLAPIDLQSMLAARAAAKGQAPAPQAPVEPAAIVERSSAPPAQDGQSVTVPRSAVAEPAAAAAGPAFVPRAKTVPMNQGTELRAQMVRAGLVPSLETDAPPPAEAPPVAAPAPPLPAPKAPDPLVATVSQLTFETRASTAPDSEAPAPAAAAPAPGAPPPAVAPSIPRNSGKALGVAAAVLSLLLVGIVVALVSVLRSPPPSASTAPKTASPAQAPSVTAAPVVTPTAAPTTEPTATATAEPASTASAEPTASASAAPSATASASAKASAAPTATAAPDRGKGSGKAPAPKGTSRVQQLGSGL